MINKLVTIFLLSVLIGSVESMAAPLILKPWERPSNPSIMSTKFKKRFTALPLAGLVIESKKYWSSDYWSLKKGNINYRWNSEFPTGFNLISPDKLTLRKMSIEERKALSPAEKFDVVMGRYSYPLKQQVAKRSSPRRKEWEGICHGWAAATLNHNEPTPKIVKNPQGFDIPFGSSDIKALLSYYYAYYDKPVSTHQMGRRCSKKDYCTDDLNAGAFHVVLANKVGIEGSSFITDIENGREVWNQVVHSYRSTILEDNIPPASTSAKGTVKVVRLKTNVKVVFNIVKNSWLPSLGTPLQTYKDKEYEYDLDIDREGKIIGGDWRSVDRPDFIWKVKAARKFAGMMSGLKFLLND